MANQLYFIDCLHKAMKREAAKAEEDKLNMERDALAAQTRQRKNLSPVPVDQPPAVIATYSQATLSPHVSPQKDATLLTSKISSRLSSYLEGSTSYKTFPDLITSDISQFQSEIRANNERLRAKIQALRHDVSTFQDLRNSYGLFANYIF